MAQNIDQRVVSMVFDNNQFNSKVSQTVSTLDKLKKGLNLSDSAKGLDKISSAAGRVDFNGMSSGLESVKLKFSALEVMAITALSNITTKVIDTGANIVKSLTLEPIMDGFREYETQMNAVQTIMANTSSKGTTLEDVNGALAELNTYADKTIYNFTEMTRNIGTFTAAGVDLDTSTAAIKGIANLAAVSGSNSQQASTAMYQLSQALASGTVKLMDWNSVVNAGMGGQVFQDALKETAKVHGLSVDKMIEDEGSFRETLQLGWLSSDILTETLSKFTGDLNEQQLKTMGYNEEQIAGIMKMGDMANDAATKVKTMSQLMDTLKEAVGSGWAQTWQTLFGDFEEAKVMFTAVSDTLGGIIQNASDARNNLLTGWKDLGGRTAVIETISTAFHNLMDVVSAVSQGFREVFPAATAEQLYNITIKIKDFVSNLKLSDTGLNNLKNTAKGVFAIFDIVKNVMLSFGNAIGIVLGGSGNLIDDILQMTGNIGYWIAEFDKAVQSSDILGLSLAILADIIKKGFDGIDFIFDNIGLGLTKIAELFNMNIVFDGFQAFHDFASGLLTQISEVTSGSISMKDTISEVMSSIYQAVSGCTIVKIIQSASNTISNIVKGIRDMVSGMVDKIREAFSADFGGISEFLGSLSLGGIAAAITKLLLDISKPIANIGEIGENLTGVLGDVRGCFEQYQNTLKAEILKKIAVAIAILAGSIFLISKIEPDRLASSLTAIGTLFAQLLVAMKLYTKIGDLSGVTLKANLVMITMATAILILSKAMVDLAQLDWNGVAKGGASILILAGTLVGASKLMEGTGAMKGTLQMVVFAAAIKVLASVCTDLSTLSWEGLAKGLGGVMVLISMVSLFLNNTTFSSKGMIAATGMVIMASAIKILGSACIDLSSLDWEGLAKGLVGIGVLLTGVSLFLNNTKFSSKGIISATGILILSGALKVLASATKDFAEMDWEEMKLGLIGVSGVLVAIGVFTKANGNTKNIMSTGVSLAVLSVGIKVLASATKDFSSMNWEELKLGLMGMGGALTIVVAAVKMMPKNLISTGAGLAIVSASLLILSSAMQKLGSMSWADLQVSLVALGGALGILAIGLNAMSGTLLGSAALLVASGALAILAPALMLLGTMSWQTLLQGLLGLAGAIGVFAVSAALLTPLIPAMIGLSGAMLLFSGAIIGIGAGLVLIGTGITALAGGITALAATTAVSATAIVASFGIIITGIIEMIPQILTQVAEGIVSVVQVIGEAVPTIVGVVLQILVGVLDAIAQNTPAILDKVLLILSQVLQAVINWLPTIAGQVVDILLAILKVIADNVAKFVNAAMDIMVGFVKGITDSLPKIIDAAAKCIITFINGLADAIRNNAGPMADACANLVSAVVEGVGKLSGKFVEMGMNAVKGFIKGLGQLGGEIINAGKELGSKALNAAKDFLNIHSPSRKFAELGRYSGQGLIVGLNDYGDKVANAGSELGANALNGVQSSISQIGDFIDNNLDSDPVIRPVMDLSQIQNGANTLNSLIGDNNLSGTIRTTGEINRSMNAVSNPESPINDTLNNTNINTDKIKQPLTLQLMLQNGKAIAEYIVDDLDSLMGSKNVITGRMAGVR